MSLERIVRFGVSTKFPKGEASYRQHNLLKVTHAETQLHEIARKYDGEKRVIVSNRDLSPDGKAKQLKQAASAAVSQVDRIQSDIGTPLSGQVKDLERALNIPLPSPDETPAQVLREQEARAILRNMDPSDRHRVIVDAIQRRDRLVIGAVFNAPVVPLAPDKVLGEYARLWATQENPKAAAEAADIREGLDALQANVAEVRNAIITDVGL